MQSANVSLHVKHSERKSKSIQVAYRKFRATQLFDGYRFRENLVLVTEVSGKIIDLVHEDDAGDDVEYLEGILTPGFINAHCHLELSHLKGVIPPHTGLIEFLCSVVTKRDFPREIIDQAIQDAEQEMYQNGIVAVGDIGNTADTASVKTKSRIRWQNFVEVLSMTDDRANQEIAHYTSVAQQLSQSLQFSDIRHRTSLVPHAPYTISPSTFRQLNDLTEGQVISMHNQEHPAEDVLYQTGGGDYLKLFNVFGLHDSPFPVTGKSSIRSVLPYFNKGQQIFLVHNTFMPKEDIAWANEYASKNNMSLVYCLCPSANSYIENKLPDVRLFQSLDCHLVLGTDSYSSNWQLSIAEEIRLLNHQLKISIEDLLRMATLNGARALRWDDTFGSFEKDKMPGLVLLSDDLRLAKRIL
jgi:cytosine/adenosine deaminase-related metal-dependent hydrolase